LFQENHNRNSEINDETLENRLKSLTSFINNREPINEEQNESKNENKSQENVTENLSTIETSASGDQYYKMIEDKVKNKIENKDESQKSFDNLNRLLDNLKTEDSIISSTDPFIMPSAPLQETTSIKQTLFETNRLIDFNLDKIKQMNQLHYPRLSWNKTNIIKEDIKDEANLSNLEDTNHINLSIVTELTRKKNQLIELELMRFFDRDQLCKDLEVYYKCKQIQSDHFDFCLDHFITNHSVLNEFSSEFSNQITSKRKHEFYELVKDYYEARLLVNKCIRHVNEFKWECIANQMRKIWSFEKYTIESSGTCSDQQRCKHELKSEKAYLNRIELQKMQVMLFELRFNLIKTGLISSQFCSKLAKCKIESYLNNFLVRFKQIDDLNNSKKLFNIDDSYININDELKHLIDILFYFNRKQMKPSLNIIENTNRKLSKPERKASNDYNNHYYEIDDSNELQSSSAATATATIDANKIESETPSNESDETNNLNEDIDDESNNLDELFKSNVTEWLKVLCCLLINESENKRYNSLINYNSNLFIQYSNFHFENTFFLIQHLLRSPNQYIVNYSYLFQFPLLLPISGSDYLQIFKFLGLNNPQSDSLIHLYFDNYLKLFASFSYDVKYRSQFLFVNTNAKNKKFNKENSNSNRFYDEQDVNSLEASSNWQLVDLDGDLESIESVIVELKEDDLIKLYYQIPFNSIYSFLWDYLTFQNNDEFRKRYVAMKILSFLDYLSRLSIRSLIIYNKLKYKNFSKLIGKTLKDSIKFAGSIMSTKQNNNFQLHCDHFVKRIFTTIIYSPRVKSIRWTILSNLNLNSLSLNTKWLILSIMCGIDVYHPNFESIFNDINSFDNNMCQIKKKDYILQACKNDLENILSEYQENGVLLTHELLSYLRTLHFLINLNHNDIDTESLNVKYHDLINDHDTDQLENHYIDHETQTLDIELYEFMSCVVKIIFKIAYCYETTKEICYKEGNSLLFAVCSAYPRLIGYVLHEIDIELANIGKRSLYLSDELPYSKWLSYIDCEQDLNFLEKCLLTNTTNSILFHLAVSCIDNLDFNQSTHRMSDDRFKNWLNKNQNNPHSKNLYQLLIKNGIDISKLVKIKLSIILFELHSRLTIYNYYTFNRNTSNNNNSNLNSELSISNLPPHNSSNNIYPQLFSTDKDKEDLQTHYQKLTKEKRLGLVNWIWSTLYKMNIFVLIDSSPQFIDYLEELSYIYSKKNHNTNHHGYINRFYHIFLSHQSNQYQSIEMSTMLMQQEIHDDHESLVENSSKKQIPQLQFVFQPKCPLESFLTLVYTRSGHDLNYIFDHSIDLIQTILNTNKKQQNIQLTQTSYYIVFDWLENLIFKHFVEKINIKNQSTASQSVDDLMHHFRLAKQSNLTKLSQLLLTIFNSAPLNQSNTILDVYCSKIYNRLVKLENFKSELLLQNYSSNSYMEQIDSNKNNYLYIWIEILMSSIKNWHKYKNIVKIIDFLISYSFNNTSSNFFVNQNLLDELFSYVRNDFGLTKTQSSSNNSANISSDTPMSENITIQQHQNVLSNWLHPSISWLSSSLTNVVTNTASQITGTVGAAIGINGSNSSNVSNNDFESYQQQLTYDKRLYKECPFIGFYLSLCEERIESQLQLWTTFRSFLIGSSDNLTGGSNLDQTTTVSNSNLLSSPSFIDSCWRKTLISINKTNNLNLSFPPQRLMLFKWCERALELPVDHPLLILYWQKFFDIYLEKEIHSNFSSSSSSSSNNKNELELKNTSSSLSAEKTHHQSSTFKLFTSTSQLNSLLKQMKKQLEMTSEHYAYECTNKQNNNNNNASNETPSAPISNYHFNEFISKLYYALSLWIDETRLHDPNLYLPALPSHYEPNLLSKIFAKQSDLWIQYIDMNRLNLNLNKIVQSGFKNDISNSIKLKKSFEISSSNRKNSNQIQKNNHKDDKNSIFFKQSDRLVLSLPSISQLNLKFNCALKEKFGNSIDNLLNVNKTLSKDEMNLILNICENLIRNIFKYNKEVINHSLNHLLKLDEKLTSKLLIHLWHNEMCEKYVQVPCTSLINPMHQCARPAMVKFVYEIATKRDQFRQEIKQNRINHDKLISNLIEYIPANSQNDINHVEINRFPNDDIIKSMVAMNQLIKKLLKNYHITLQQQNDSNNQFDSNSQMLLTRMFYLLIDLYETLMTHPTDVLNPFKERGSSSSIPTFLSCKNDDFESFNSIIEQQSLTDSIHLYIFDLIHLIGSNFIQSISNESQIIGLSNLRRRNQQILLEKIIQKLTSTLSLSNLIERSSSSNNLSSSTILNSSSTNMSIGSTPTTSSSSSSALKKQNTILLNLTRNKLLLMSLCAQYVEPDDLDLFNEFYTNILCSISSILINEAKGQANSVDSVEMINQKFAIILQLLSKFSYINLKKLIDVNCDQNDLTSLSTSFVEININFLMDLKLDVADYKTNFSQETQENQIQRQIIKEKNLKLIIDQCIDNFVSILDIQYPIFFEYMLKKCLEFSASPLTSKYGSKHLIKLNLIIQQQEILYNQNEKLKKEQYEMAIEFLAEYFNFERIKFRSQKRSFYSHWFIYCRELSDFYSTLFTTYFDRYVLSDLTKIKVSNISEEMKIFQNKFDKLFEILLKLYTIWIEPDSIKEAIGHSLINVKEIYENEIAILGDKNETNNLTSQGAACILFFSSFLSVFHNIFERLNLFTINNQIEHINIIIEIQHACKNYALNKMFHYYYEQIASTLNSISAINDNVLDCYHKCLSKYSSSWYGIMQANNVGFQYEPDYQSINIMMELCLAPNSRLVRYLAFDIVSYLDFNLICESYFRKMEIMPMQINDLLKCWLQLLAEFCLRDSIRESNQFDGLLRPIYNQAEVLQCWSMLSDTSYSDVVLNRFCQIADYHYAFATRGTDRGLLMNLLKSAGEFYSLTDRNSISCFSSAKRRCYLKAVCHLLLKPSISTIKLDIESFQNCVINLLTDIETFSISAVSSAAAEDFQNISNNGNDTINSLNIKHEIQLLIDECLTLISYNNDQQVSHIYRSLFESWLSSSKDSPILTHFINRISRNFDMLTAPNTSSFENYCNLLELCLDVFFETNRSNDDLESSAKKNAILLNDNLINDSIYWKCLMEEIEFRLNNYSVDLECLKHSTYLLLSLYMNQRLAILKANPSNSNFSEMLKYCEQILNSFLSNNSRPKQTSEDKFILIINKLLEIYLYILSNALLLELKSQVGEQLVKLSNLFNYYGEDTLSNQNPLNDNQSIGSDLLASIGFNILSKKSPFYIDFRFYSRCMSICILRQILIIDQSKLTIFNDKLFPNLNQIENEAKDENVLKNCLFKVKMTQEDNKNDPSVMNETIQFSCLNTMNKISASLPNNQTLNFSPTLSSFSSSAKSMINSFNQILKQASQQFNLIFQTKSYYNNSLYIELANYVNQNVQNPTQSQYFCLPQVYNMNRYLSAQLFKEKQYLF
jgi:hypothetical protein